MNEDDAALHRELAPYTRKHAYTPTGTCYYCGTHRKHARTVYCTDEDTY